MDTGCTYGTVERPIGVIGKKVNSMDSVSFFGRIILFIVVSTKMINVTERAR